MAQTDDKKNDDGNTNPAGADDLSADAATEQTDDQPTDDDAGTGDSAAETATDDTDQVSDESGSGADTFSRTYVEKLRRENAGYRERANRADDLAKRLHTALVQATGRLADPTDLPFDAAHLDDPDALAAAIDALLAGKPHLASRRPFGDVGQGNRGNSAEPVNLADMLRARA